MAGDVGLQDRGLERRRCQQEEKEVLFSSSSFSRKGKFSTVRLRGWTETHALVRPSSSRGGSYIGADTTRRHARTRLHLHTHPGTDMYIHVQTRTRAYVHICLCIDRSTHLCPRPRCASVCSPTGISRRFYMTPSRRRERDRYVYRECE